MARANFETRGKLSFRPSLGIWHLFWRDGVHPPVKLLRSLGSCVGLFSDLDSLVEGINLTLYYPAVFKQEFPYFDHPPRPFDYLLFYIRQAVRIHVPTHVPSAAVKTAPEACNRCRE